MPGRVEDEDCKQETEAPSSQRALVRSVSSLNPLPPQDKIGARPEMNEKPSSSTSSSNIAPTALDEVPLLKSHEQPNSSIGSSNVIAPTALEEGSTYNDSSSSQASADVELKPALRQRSAIEKDNSQLTLPPTALKDRQSARQTVRFDGINANSSSVCEEVDENDSFPVKEKAMTSFDVESAGTDTDSRTRSTWRTMMTAHNTLLLRIPGASCSPKCVQNLVICGGLTLTLLILLFTTWISLGDQMKEPCEIKFCTRVSNASTNCSEAEECALCDAAEASDCKKPQHNKCSPPQWSRYPACQTFSQESDVCGNGRMMYSDDLGFYCHVKCAIEHCLEVELPRQENDCSEATCGTCDSGYKISKDYSGHFCSIACMIDHCENVNVARDAEECSGATCKACETGFLPSEDGRNCALVS